jgi:hypothetical protein
LFRWAWLDHQFQRDDKWHRPDHRHQFRTHDKSTTMALNSGTWIGTAVM